MEKNWKEDLSNLFEDLVILSESKQDTLEKFEQFCEFVVEPAFESLKQELKQHKISSKFMKAKGESIAFQINFPKSRVDNFHYIISLPKNSVELKLKLKLQGRKNKKGLLKEREELFMDNLRASDILNLQQEQIIKDIIAYYRSFIFEAITHSD